MTERELKLRKFFNTTLAGQKPLAPSQKDLFIEAFCSQADVIGCLNQVRNSQQGLQIMQNVMRFDLSEAFFNAGAVKVLTYLQGPDVVNIDSGKFVFQYLHAIVEPPIFWTPFCEAFKAQRLGGEAQKCFAWVLLQLIMLSDNDSAGYRARAQDPQIVDILLNSPDLELRTYGQKLKNSVGTADEQGEYRPGGRHDNDFEDYREISILPTGDEVMSTEAPFLRRRADVDDPETLETRAAIYLDNQFRLLREDMLSGMREEIQIAQGQKKGLRRGFSADGLELVDVHCTPDVNRDRWGILLRLSDEFPQFRNLNPIQRLDYLRHQPKFLAHQSLTCLFGDGRIIGFASIQRDATFLARSPPILLLHPHGSQSMIETLLTKLQSSTLLSIMQINTALFAYEPVLKVIQSMKTVPLEEEILFWHDGDSPVPPRRMATHIISLIQEDPHRDLQGVLRTTKSIKLDESQSRSLLAGLSQRVALIQGPPGTGKSFIGALLAKAIHRCTSQRILVVCYTNHALDQFLEDLLDIGIPIKDMVRLGGKFSSRTEQALMRNQVHEYRFGKTTHAYISALKSRLQDISVDLQHAFDWYKLIKVRADDILAYLEFGEPDFFEAFSVPVSAEGEVLVGKRGRKILPTYLLEQWMRGQDAGVFKDHSHIESSKAIWTTPKVTRLQRISEWQGIIIQEKVSEVVRYAMRYNYIQDHLDFIFAQKDIAILQDKRIVGCTTTAAAKYARVLRSAPPQVLLVEEAGEILESHVLTALGRNMEQLILIGDHKQLRPKVNDYALTVEKGEGYDLNVSLFERLVIKGYPHETLNAQHRMRPEISRLVRELTYPDLVDAPSTQGRPDTRGLRDNVIFIDHSHPEDVNPEIVDRFATSSKQNSYEVAIVIKIVRYLAQQGYGTDSMVVLTPYLGQLNNLLNEFKRDTDPILNDLDSLDLVRAGLVTQASAKLTKKPVRLATIDNYQGEESDIVIISLTRSNPNNDIGFMFSPERLNVLLSRARNGLIIVGNATTYTHSKKGGELWSKLIDLLRSGGHLYEGLPVKCERHPSRIATLVNTDDFDTLCPDGGCAEPCGSKLSCGLHTCPSKCHQLVDHSKMKCLQIMMTQCPNGKHTIRYKCHHGPPPNCRECEQDVKRREQKAQQDFELKQKQEAEQLAHVKKMAEIEAEIERERQPKLRDAQLAREREDAIRQRKEELAETIRMATAGNIQKSTSDDGDGIEDKGRSR